MRVSEKLKKIEREFAEVINRNGLDTLCNMPDYILASYVVSALSALKAAHVANTVHSRSSAGPS